MNFRPAAATTTHFAANLRDSMLVQMQEVFPEFVNNVLRGMLGE
jgi:hypothetical protein